MSITTLLKKKWLYHKWITALLKWLYHKWITTLLKKKVVPHIVPPEAAVISEYLLEQHNIAVDPNTLDPAKYHWLAFTEDGKLAVHGDPKVHEKLQLPDSYQVFTSSAGVYHYSYDPSKVQPKFFEHHDAGVVSTY